MDEQIGRGRVGRIAWIVGGLAALALAGVAAAMFAPAAPVEALPLMFAIVAVAAATGAYHQGTVLRRRADKVSSEMDALSARLLRLEGRVSEAPPQTAAVGLTSAVAEV